VGVALDSFTCGCRREAFELRARSRFPLGLSDFPPPYQDFAPAMTPAGNSATEGVITIHTSSQRAAMQDLRKSPRGWRALRCQFELKASVREMVVSAVLSCSSVAEDLRWIVTGSAGSRSK
jgi:hypothetical protein